MTSEMDKILISTRCCISFLYNVACLLFRKRELLLGNCCSASAVRITPFCHCNFIRRK